MDYLILLSSIVLGALTVFGFKLHEPQHVKLLNAFTGAFLLSLTLLHLLPELYDFHHGGGGENEAITTGRVDARRVFHADSRWISFPWASSTAMRIICTGMRRMASWRGFACMPSWKRWRWATQHTYYDPASRKLLLVEHRGA